MCCVWVYMEEDDKAMIYGPPPDGYLNEFVANGVLHGICSGSGDWWVVLVSKGRYILKSIPFICTYIVCGREHTSWPVPVCCLRNLPISPTIRKQEHFLPSHPLYILLRWWGWGPKLKTIVSSLSTFLVITQFVNKPKPPPAILPCELRSE